MVYPGRPLLQPLPQFIGTATTRQTPEQRDPLLDHVEKGYRARKSLRVLAAERGSSQSKV